MPKISIVIPTYNCAQYILKAIESVIAQTYKDFEIIIIDDGSNDNTRAVLDPYIDAGKIKYFYQKNKGVSAARNKGIKVSESELITFLDSDDIWEPEFLEEMIFKETHYKMSVCDCSIVYYGERGEILDKKI